MVKAFPKHKSPTSSSLFLGSIRHDPRKLAGTVWASACASALLRHTAEPYRQRTMQYEGLLSPSRSRLLGDSIATCEPCEFQLCRMRLSMANSMIPDVLADQARTLGIETPARNKE